ncbi:E1 ubiquitin-activating protein aos1 [Coemansia sp. IMI 203386]|nr:E1 ubiquitin-activating protein aos1 [Coemansia sp. IMI 203386]
MSSTTNEISRDEVALYDRQIRLWGMEAQKRLGASKVKIRGSKAVTLEVCKNLVLAGIGSLYLIDSTAIDEKDLETQYYFNEQDLGKPRDKVLADRLRVLNPLVNIEVGDVDEICDVVVNVGNGGESMEINKRCRDRNECFVAVDSFGLFGYIFVDCLDKHEYIEEVKLQGDAGETKKESFVATYVALQQSISARPGISNLNRLVRKYPPLVFVSQALSTSVCKNAEELAAQVEKTMAGRGLPEGVVNNELLQRVARSLDTEFVPCAAVVGGTLAQEILKIITRKDLPANNWYVYDALQTDGIVCKL